MLLCEKYEKSFVLSLFFCFFEIGKFLELNGLLIKYHRRMWHLAVVPHLCYAYKITVPQTTDILKFTIVIMMDFIISCHLETIVWF